MSVLKDFENEEALDCLACLIEPLGEFGSDVEVAQLIVEKKYFKASGLAVKKHKKEAMQILATLDGVPIEEYHGNLIKMLSQLAGFFKDLIEADELRDFLVSVVQIMDETSSGDVTESM